MATFLLRTDFGLAGSFPLPGILASCLTSVPYRGAQKLDSASVVFFFHSVFFSITFTQRVSRITSLLNIKRNVQNHHDVLAIYQAEGDGKAKETGGRTRWEYLTSE